MTYTHLFVLYNRIVETISLANFYLGVFVFAALGGILLLLTSPEDRLIGLVMSGCAVMGGCAVGLLRACLVEHRDYVQGQIETRTLP